MSAGVNTLVCTFITRGTKGTVGQGSELLWYTPADRRGHEPDKNSLEYVQVEVLPGLPAGNPDSALVASHGCIARNLFLDAKKDLCLVRRSKRVPWQKGSYIEALVWRTTEAYERGFEYEYERSLAEQEQRRPNFPADLDRDKFELDLALYRVVEQKLGVQHHMWESFAYFDKHPSPLEFVSTAYYLSILPPVLDQLLPVFASLKGASSADVSELALNVLFEIVSNRIAMHAFKFWAPGVPPPSQGTKATPAGVYKYRLYAYWLDVVAHHLRSCNPALETTLSSTFLRTLQSIQPLVTDPAVSVEAFEKAALAGIASEHQRGQFAGGVLDKLAIGKILERPIGKGAAPLTKRPLLQIVTLGNSPVVFSVLRELIHYLLTISAHPYSTLNPGINPLTKQQEIEWLNRPDLLKVTIAESRPNCDGVVLAKRLHDVVEMSADRAKHLREMGRSHSDPRGAGAGGGASPGGGIKLPQTLRERLKQGLGRTGEDGAPMGTYGTLEGLMNAVNSNTNPLGASKVTIEVVPDAAVVSLLRAAPAGTVVVLLGAERILPGDSDIVAKMGSFVLAWCGKEVKANVYALAATECIESSFKPSAPPMPTGDPNELVAGWKASSAAAEEGIDGFAAKALNKDIATAAIAYQTSEIVSHKIIDGWITENGVLSAEGCASLGKERGTAEKALYGTLG